MLEIFLYIIGVGQGFAIAYMLWAPDSNFKRGFVDGMSLKFLWKRFVK